MCGLVAFITKKNNGFSKEQVDAFDNLLYIDALRGMDSTGVFSVDNQGNMSMAKEATPSFVYRTKGAYDDLLKTAFRNGRALVGHNRAATKGTVIDENAHPFVVDDRITLVHNGTLWGDFRKMAGKNVDVDSHAIAHVIHEHDDNVEKALQKVTGAYALIWHDFKNNTLNFIRNEQRPLHYVEVESGWIWASEDNMLEWILARYDFKPMKDGVCMLPPSTLVTYNFTNGGWAVDNKKINTTPAVVYTPPATGQQHRHMHPYAFGYDEDYGDACEVKPASNVLQLPHTTRAATTGRIFMAEGRLAAANTMSISREEFTANECKINDGDYETGTVVDYDDINPTDASQGRWMYAILDCNPNYLIRQYVEPNVEAKELNAMVVGSETVLFHIVSKIWRPYTDTKAGAGYVMLNSDEFVLCERAATT